MSRVKEQLLTKDLLRRAKGRTQTREGELVLGNNRLEKGPLTVKLADVWGFCYGVLYAIEAVGEVLEQYPERTVWILGELIHNNHVNHELERLGATIIDPEEVDDRVGPDDIVVVPAFGTREEIFEYLDEENLHTVDTTCPEVRDVEQEVQQFNEMGLTTIIHGKHEHQESIATSSFADRYLIVRDQKEARYVCDYIREGGSREDFLDRFGHACSPDFDPDEDLRHIGLANQTTMLMNESMEIFRAIEDAVEARDGNTKRVHSIDTICSATQDRQDAVQQLTRGEAFDLFLVVGGHTSSNTKNLARTVHNRGDIPAYHIEDQESFDERTITYLPHDASEPVTVDQWLPDGEITVGVTAGASTPHSDLEAILRRLLSFY